MATTNYVWERIMALVGPIRSFQNATSGLGATAGAAALTHESRAIIVHGNAGKLKVKFADVTAAVTIPSVSANTIYPFCVTHVYTVTGGATQIYAYW